MKNRKSLKSKVTFVLMKMLILLIVFIIGYNFYTLNEANIKVAESNQKTLSSYCSNIETTLQTLLSRMTNFISNNTNFKLMTQKGSEVAAHVQSYEIMQDYNSLMDMYPLLSGCFIFSYPNTIFRSVYGNSISLDSKDELLWYFKDATADKKRVLEMVWQPLTLGERHYLYLISGYQNTYCIYVIDLGNLYFVQNNPETGGSGSRELIFYQEETIFTDSAIIRENSVDIRGGNGYYFSGSPQRYMVVEQAIANSKIRAAYLVEYRGVLGNLSYAQLSVFIVSLLTVLLIPYSYQQLKKVFFIPMDILMETMNEIKDGKIEARVDTNYTEVEFLEVINTFNSMIDQINQLKIDAFEQELNLRETQLQYYQIQIKPHFYINCLKSMYGMVVEEKYEDTKSAIIYLSNHLRYMLKNVSMIVSIGTELKYIQNYIALQRLSMAYRPDIKVDADPALMGLMIPAISILSFVENSVKHAVIKDNNLHIGIQINSKLIEEEKYLNIRVTDNGAGFSREQVVYLNNYLENPQTEQSIGIYNVIQRYLLYFGEDNVWFAFSNMGGANIDIFIKMIGGEIYEHSNR